MEPRGRVPIDFRTPRQGRIPASLHVFTDLNPDHTPPPLENYTPTSGKQNWRDNEPSRNIKVLTSWAERILVAD